MPAIWARAGILECRDERSKDLIHCSEVSQGRQQFQNVWVRCVVLQLLDGVTITRWLLGVSQGKYRKVELLVQQVLQLRIAAWVELDLGWNLVNRDSLVLPLCMLLLDVHLFQGVLELLHALRAFHSMNCIVVYTLEGFFDFQHSWHVDWQTS